MFNKIFYKPADWISSRLTARQRRAINAWLLIFWLIPGFIIWLILRDALWFIGFMSIYAIWTGHLGALAAETPVEQEELE